MSKVIVSDLSRIDVPMQDLCRKIDSDLPILLISRQENLIFNEEIFELEGRPYLVVDAIENGWNWDMKETLVIGRNVDQFRTTCHNDQWDRLNDFVAANKPILYFKRELLKKDKTDWLVPINYPCLHTVPEPDTKEQFDNRVLQVHNTWGLSHEDRKRVHAEIWINAGKYGYSVCDSPYYLEDFIKIDRSIKLWFTANIPHYRRLPMNQVLYINSLSKISLSLPGAGRCCFRHTESPINSTMLMINDTLCWSYDWINGENCIKSDFGKEIETIVGWLNSPDLYQVYKAGVENCKKYETENYIANYILPLINNAKSL